MTESNNTIPTDLIAVPKYDGYFWCPTDKTVYSLKVTGTLTPLAFQRGRHIPGGHYAEAGFAISIGGRKRRLTMDYLNKLSPTTYQVPIRRRWTDQGEQA